MNIAEKYMTDMELNEPSNPLEINKTEDKLKIKFPEQYKKFLLSHNGAEGSIGENSYLVIWSIEDTLNFVSSVNSMSKKRNSYGIRICSFYGIDFCTGIILYFSKVDAEIIGNDF